MKIHVIDKHPILRKGLLLLLKESLPNVELSDFESVVEYLGAASGNQTDLLIIGGKQHTSNLIEDIQAITRVLGERRVLIYDDYTDDEMAVPYLMAGVSGYISKEKPVDELIKCVNNLINGKKSFHLNTTEIIYENQKKSSRQSREISQAIAQRLSPREYQVAKLLSRGMRITLIAKYMGLSTSTVGNIKKDVFSKLGLQNAFQLRGQL
jgi:DNA-binding NarL/FixJ family response regulator